MTALNLKRQNIPIGDMVEHRVFDHESKLVQSFYLFNGEVEGELKLFEDGVMRVVQNYRAGKLHGPCEYYNVEGARTGIQSYFDGKLHGASYWKTAGRERLKLQKCAFGELDGEQLEFHTNGNIRRRLRFSHGKTVGATEHFESNGAPETSTATMRLKFGAIALINSCIRIFGASKRME